MNVGNNPKVKQVMKLVEWEKMNPESIAKARLLMDEWGEDLMSARIWIEESFMEYENAPENIAKVRESHHPDKNSESNK